MSNLSSEEEVRTAVYQVFEAGKNKDFGLLARVHADEPRFSKFDDHPPYGRQNAREAYMYEEAAFASLSDYEYDIRDLRIDIFERIAIATFVLDYRGIMVNNTTFAGESIHGTSRVTMVFQRKGNEWLIVHEHLSGISDSYQRRTQQP